jgi:hypothetical protein
MEPTTEPTGGLGTRLLAVVSRPPQVLAAFEPGDPHAGFYNDLRLKAREHGTPERALAAARALTSDRRLANPVAIAQLGLGAWQLGAEDPGWAATVRHTAEWLAGEIDEDGCIAYLFPMPHTYDLRPPWHSAMAQGEAASLLVRAAVALGERDLADAGRRAVAPLCDPGSPLVATTAEGPVLQEYPTDPPAHVLNGWISALWGLYDVGCGDGAPAAAARSAFAAGAGAVAARLPLYELALGWSRYDLYPHRLPHAASPFYHRLHVEQLRAMSALVPGERAFAVVAERWGAAADRPAARVWGVALKAAFRVANPRRPPV